MKSPTDAAELPDAWKPQAIADVPRLVLPERETDDPAELAAFYGAFGWAENHRKCILANARELVRAKFAAAGEKISEARTDDLARTHPAYLNWLERHLLGRILWEREVLKQGRGG